jgi:hypothetical protein
VSNLSRGVDAEPTKGCRVTDTPIYDQMQWEFRSASIPADEPASTGARSSRRQDGTGRRVSVWALVDQHRRRS